ncbi:MAG TPA: pyruvate, phosphate dikinase [Acidimicrobiia bacterium]|nr:pyruvate, phosphate dikinase [Acidimicrobiia bacterium]
MKRVYAFEEGSKEQKLLLGGKGANLAEMVNLGLAVPPGFTITTEACREYMAGDRLPEPLMDEVAEALAKLEATMAKSLGDPDNPLLVSVRSGAPHSMPGMMETILNLGMNDRSVDGVARQTGDERFAYDSYRRFVQMYGKTALDIDGHLFEDELGRARQKRKVTTDAHLEPKDLRKVVETFKKIVERESGRPFPQDPGEQLRGAIEAVFRSWNSASAISYRRYEGIPDDLGTAVNVQCMVFGNRGDDSGTGVGFTRDPATGERRRYGDFLRNAQGEDVVAGIRITQKLDEMNVEFPECYEQLLEVMETLEQHYRDMCDIEFTIEQGKLWILQTRVGKRTAAAALRIAVDMVGEGLIDEREAVLRVKPQQLDQLLHPQFDAGVAFEAIAEGLNASPGAAVGKVVFTADDAAARAAEGERVILVRPETSPDDVHGMIAAEGILTSRGGLVSHAAVVARGMGKPAVVGAADLQIDVGARSFSVNGHTVREGDVISIDGTTGKVALGEVAVVEPEPGQALTELLAWADGFRRLAVRANADTGEDARHARAFGAEGIGLARTEHMFLGDRLPLVQRMFVSFHEGAIEEHTSALEELRAQQRSDFEDLLEAMDGLPVTVRLLDPPLHEFLPDVEELHERLRSRGRLARLRARKEERWDRRLLATARAWREVNPMLGTRGVRLAMVIPDLYATQVRALMEAAVARRRAGGDPQVEVMIPLTVTRLELEKAIQWVHDAAEEVFARSGERVAYKVGTMVETPRAALVAGDIARVAEFFSFGTNDLTQMTFGFSRDDIEGRVMRRYLEDGLLPASPFETLDVEGVGRLVEIAVREGRHARSDLKVGICGEHGGDPPSVHFCHEQGLDYVSCSPFRVPVARLAAAQAALGSA